MLFASPRAEGHMFYSLQKWMRFYIIYHLYYHLLALKATTLASQITVALRILSSSPHAEGQTSLSTRGSAYGQD
jgi:hypothetical protein